MDILIKYMEMPKSCEECPLFFEYYNPIEKKNIFHCRARGEGESRFADDFDWHTKPTEEEGCPLIPVPEHGDLIDRDDLVARFQHFISHPTGYEVVSKIFDAEVVLERTT